MKYFVYISIALFGTLITRADVYPTTSSEISNNWLMKWTGPETDINFTTDSNLMREVDGIYYNAFEGNETLRSIRFGRRIGDVCRKAFKNCQNLETVVFDNVGNVIDHLYVSDNVFSNCPKLKSVTFSEYTERISGRSFEDCPSLTILSIDNNHTEWTSHNGIIYTKNQEKLKLFPQGINGHHDLNSNVVEIEEYAFFQSRLKSIYLPDKLERIGNNAFSEAKQLTTVVFPSSLREIGRMAFSHCESMKTLLLPQSLERIEADAFYACYSLPETIKIPASVTTIDGAFCGNCLTVKRFEVAGSNMFFSTRESALYDYQGEKLIDWPWGTIGDEIAIPDGTTIIGNDVFYGAPVKEAILPTSLQKIEDEAFCYSSLEKVLIPEGVTELGLVAFGLCPNLREIELPSTLTEMKDYAFEKSGDIHRVFTCHALIPVGKTPETWGDLSTDTLYVPEESVEMYQVSPGWRNFGTIKAIPIPNNYSVTFAQSQNGLIIVTSDGDEIESGTELREGSTITIRTFAFTDYELSSLTVNDVEVEDGADIIINGPTVINAVFSTIAGIQSVQNSESVTHNCNYIYDLQGRKIIISDKCPSLPKGMYIITGKDKAKKIYVK